MERRKAKAEICRRLIEGQSLRAICADADLPSRATVCTWLATDEGFAKMYAAARLLQADTLADEAMYIADTPQPGERRKSGPDGEDVWTEDMLGHRRLQVEARKWFAGKLAPKKYGEATLLKHADAEGLRIDGSDADLALRAASLLIGVLGRKAA